MAGTKEAQHYAWIDGLSERFEGEKHLEDDSIYRWWVVQSLLAIAQQLSLVAHRLKKDAD